MASDYADAMIVALQWTSLAMWLGLVAYLTRPALRAFRVDARPLDMLWAAAWPLALNRVAFGVMNLLLNRDPVALVACHALAIAAGLFFVATVYVYRRADA